MVTMESPKPNVGKFSVQVKASEENNPQWQQRSEVLAAWLLSQWYKQQIERN